MQIASNKELSQPQPNKS